MTVLDPKKYAPEAKWPSREKTLGEEGYRGLVQAPSTAAPRIVDAKVRLTRLKTLIDSKDPRHRGEVLRLIGALKDDVQQLKASKDTSRPQPGAVDDGHHDEHDHDAHWHAEHIGDEKTRLSHETDAAFFGHAEKIAEDLTHQIDSHRHIRHEHKLFASHAERVEAEEPLGLSAHN